MTLPYTLACERADEATQRAEIAESKLSLAEASHRITMDKKDALLVDQYVSEAAHKARIKQLLEQRDNAYTALTREVGTAHGLRVLLGNAEDTLSRVRRLTGC